MPKRNGIVEKNLSKGQLRKLNALRKSLGAEIADRAFAEWLDGCASAGESADPIAERIEDAVMRLIKSEGIHIPRGGYVVRRGRGRVIVERHI